MLETLSHDITGTVETTTNSTDYQYHFFTPSTLKFVTMSICTSGMYQLYWFYKNWFVIKKSGKQCSPILRALFAPLFAYACFKYIKESMRKNKIDMNFPIGILTISYFILVASSKLPTIYGLITFLNFLPIVIANRVAIATNKAQSPNFNSDNRFTGWNWLAIIAGGLFFIAEIAGTLKFASV